MKPSALGSQTAQTKAESAEVGAWLLPNVSNQRWTKSSSTEHVGSFTENTKALRVSQ